VPHSGVDLGADLYDLETVAKNYLPAVAGVYADVLARCKHVEDGLAKFPNLPEEFTKGDFDGVTAYLGLATAAASVLEETKRNLDDTAVAL